jgi:hypothetical protein
MQQTHVFTYTFAKARDHAKYYIASINVIQNKKEFMA